MKEGGKKHKIIDQKGIKKLDPLSINSFDTPHIEIEAIERI